MRRTFIPAFKTTVAIEAIKEQRTIAEFAQEFEIPPNQVSQWKLEFLGRSVQILDGEKKQAEEIERLEIAQRGAHKGIGRLTNENEF